MIHLFDVNGTLCPYTENLDERTIERMSAIAQCYDVDIISGQPIEIIFEKIGSLADYVGTIYGDLGREVLTKDGTYHIEPEVTFDTELVNHILRKYPDVGVYQNHSSLIIECPSEEVREKLMIGMSVLFTDYMYVRENNRTSFAIWQCGKEQVLKNYHEVTVYGDSPEEYGYDHSIATAVRSPSKFIHTIFEKNLNKVLTSFSH
jgi:hypothetical protein